MALKLFHHDQKYVIFSGNAKGEDALTAIAICVMNLSDFEIAHPPNHRKLI